MTKDHKPDCSVELARIKAAGGKVVEKAGVPRVVWYRPHDPEHRGPIRYDSSQLYLAFESTIHCLHILFACALLEAANECDICDCTVV